NLLKTNEPRTARPPKYPSSRIRIEWFNSTSGIQEYTRQIRPDADITTEEMRVPGNAASGTDSFHAARDFGRSGQTRSGKGGIFRSNVAFHSRGRCGRPDGPHVEQYRSQGWMAAPRERARCQSQLETGRTPQ